MPALDILEKLSGIDIGSLDPLQRILLITDGTLTEILEAAFLERIKLVKVGQKIVPADAVPSQFMEDARGDFLERKILLQGAKSGRNYAYAESLIALDRFDAAFRDKLLNSNVPLGRLWLEHRLESFKELCWMKVRNAENLSRHFGCEETSALLARAYRLLVGAKPAIYITEYFPAKYNIA